MFLAGFCQTVTGRQIALGTLRARRVHLFLRDHALVLLAVCFSAKKKKKTLFLFYLLHLFATVLSNDIDTRISEDRNLRLDDRLSKGLLR